MLSRTESVARALLRHYLPRERFLYNLRPDWLRNPKTGRRLELDMYLPDRGIAIEIDGIQHGRFTKGLQRDFNAFTDQQAKDMHKIEVCRQRGITLYKLTSFQLTQRAFEPFIRTLLTESQWRTTPPPLHLYRQAETLSRMKVVKRPYRKPGLWPIIKRMISPARKSNLSKRY